MNNTESLHKNQELQLKIDTLSSEGVGIAHYKTTDKDCVTKNNPANKKGLAIFIPGALPGEIVNVKIVKVQNNCAYARLNSIIKTSSNRIKPECPHYRLCGGCNTGHMNYDAEMTFKQSKIEDALRHIGGIDKHVDKMHPSPEVNFYRNKSAFPVTQSGIGMFRQRSHDVIHIDKCLLQSEQANNVITKINKWISDCDIQAYDENTCSGMLRHVLVRTNYHGSYLVCLVVTQKNVKHIEILKEKLASDKKCIGLHLNINSKNTNVILGNEYINVFGQNTITDKINDLNFKLSIPSFFQINRDQAANLYKRAIELANISKNDTIIDLYCGAGTITLTMAKYCKFAYGVEIISPAVINAIENSKLNKIDNVEFICADAGKATTKLIDKGVKLDVICVDPPRKGLDTTTIQAIQKLSPERIIYISCKPSTLARDLKLFTEASEPYYPKAIEGFDMFPRTHHVETLVLLTKQKN